MPWSSVSGFGDRPQLHSLVEASYAIEAVLNHVFIDFLLQFSVAHRLLEFCLVDPVQGLEATTVEFVNIDLLVTGFDLMLIRVKTLIHDKIHWGGRYWVFNLRRCLDLVPIFVRLGLRGRDDSLRWCRPRDSFLERLELIGLLFRLRQYQWLNHRFHFYNGVELDLLFHLSLRRSLRTIMLLTLISS